MAPPVRICFVCLGNICRSPTAEAVFLDIVSKQGLTDRFEIDSAGTGGWHVGELAHPDTREAAKNHGVEIRSRARQFKPADFSRFDYVIAMDRSNRDNLREMAKGLPGAAERVSLFRSFDPDSADEAEVPDPYYSGGFDRVYEICEAAAHGLLAELRRKHDL